jgi:hypothetical protein
MHTGKVVRCLCTRFFVRRFTEYLERADVLPAVKSYQEGVSLVSVNSCTLLLDV